MKLSIIIPIYNEEKNIEELSRRLYAVLKRVSEDFEIIYVNDGSTDKSLSLLKSLAQRDKRIKIISFSRNFGHQVAITAGLDNCRGDCAVIIDGDLQDPPELIPKLINKWQEDYQVVYAKRESRQGEPYLKLITAFVFYRVIKKIAKIDMPVDVGDFRLIDRQVIEALKKMPERQRFIRGMVAWTGFNQTGVKFKRDERGAGKTKYSYSKSIELALAGITSFSFIPLRLATYLGLIVSGLSFLYGIYVLYLKFIRGMTVQGWASIMVTVLFLGGVQLITLGIIGEYIGRLGEESKQRPTYVVKEKINF